METHLHHTAEPTILEEQDPGNFTFNQLLEPCSTGLEAVDRYLHGFKPGYYTLLTGSSRQGKTHLALKLAYDVARDNQQPGEVWFYTAATAPAILYKLLVCSIAGCQANKELSTQERERLLQAVQEVKKSSFTIIDAQNMTSKQVISNARQKLEQSPCKLIIIDFPHMIRVEGRSYSLLSLELADKLSKDLLRFAREANVHVLALRLDDTKYTLSDDLMVMDSDAHLFLEFEKETLFPNETIPRTPLSWLHVNENKHGDTGCCQLRWDKKKLRFTEVVS